MQEKSALIGIYDEQGNLVSKKSRREVDKKKDVLKTINILLVNSKDEVFMIRTKDSVWQKKLWGGSCATLLRYNEKPREAVKRLLLRELNLKDRPEFIEEKYYNWNGVKRFLSIFKLKTNKEPKPNSNDFYETKWISQQEAKNLIKKNKCMPTFEAALSLINNKKQS